MQIHKKKYHLGYHPSGVALDIAYYHLIGGDKGKKIYIQSGIHGGEITYWIIEKLYLFLQKHGFEGELILVPTANPVSWMQRTYFSTFGKFDLYMGKDWNLCFPGKEYGTLAEKICYALASLATTCDIILDLHTSRASFPFLMLTNNHETEQLAYAAKEEIAYAKIMKIPYVMVSDEVNPHDGTDYYSSLGIPAITVECGSHDSYEPEYIDQIYDGILRLLGSFEMIDNQLVPASDQHIVRYTDIKNYRAPEGGFAKIYKKIGDQYKKGELLFDIINPQSIGQHTSVYADEDGIIQKLSPTYIYRPGDDVMTGIPSSYCVTEPR